MIKTSDLDAINDSLKGAVKALEANNRLLLLTDAYLRLHSLNTPLEAMSDGMNLNRESIKMIKSTLEFSRLLILTQKEE